MKQTRFAIWLVACLFLGGCASQAYLDGCYALGMQYPDLCASIYLLCGKGVYA